jgi:hypothetical protein
VKCWSFSQILPLISPEQQFELRGFTYGAGITDAMIGACVEAGLKSINPNPTPNIALITSVGAPARRFFMNFPTYEEWSHLDRTGVLQRLIMDENGELYTVNSIMIDALH